MNQESEQSRRRFLQTGITLSTLLPLLGTPLSSTAGSQEEELKSRKATHPLSILILGGTSFLGPQQIAYALQRGHRISTFTRGRTEPTVQKDVFDEV